MYQTKCLHPNFILNPSIFSVRNILKIVTPYRTYSMSLLASYQDVSTNMYRLNVSRLTPDGDKVYSYLGHAVTVDNYADYQIVTTTDVLPLVYCVPCGKCALCLQRRTNALRVRCDCEAQLYSTLPMFVTLTVDNDHLSPTGVSKSVMDLFLKRLRIATVRAGYAIDNMYRYLCCGEYGDLRHRQHYHILFFNVPRFSQEPHLQLDKFESLVIKAWRNGRVFTEMCSNTRCSTYIAKYLDKDTDVPDGMSPKFVHWSRGKHGYGALGAPFVDKHRDWIVANPTQPYQYRDVLTGQVRKLSLCTYFINRLFPSYTRLVPIALRRAYDFVSEYVALGMSKSPLMSRRVYQSVDNNLSSHLGGCPIAYASSSLHRHYYESGNSLKSVVIHGRIYKYVDFDRKLAFKNLYADIKPLISAINKYAYIDFDAVDVAVQRRNMFLASLPSEIEDLSVKSDIIIRKNAKSAKLLHEKRVAKLLTSN